jgi:hypothetical protein
LSRISIKRQKHAEEYAQHGESNFQQLPEVYFEESKHSSIIARQSLSNNLFPLSDKQTEKTHEDQPARDADHRRQSVSLLIQQRDEQIEKRDHVCKHTERD